MTTREMIGNVLYATHGGSDLCLDLHLPEREGPFPVVLGIPGGGWRNCARANVATYLVDAGFAMACIDYRVSEVAIAPANVTDCRAALSWLGNHAADYDLNTDLIGAYGASAGGHLAALLGVSATVLEFGEHAAVPAVSDACGPTDLSRIVIPEIREQFPVLYEVTEQYLGGPVHERAELARLVSPLSYVSADCPPMLIVHGSEDPTVPVEESTIFHAALEDAGADSSLFVVEGAGHGWLLDQTADVICSFFEEKLA